MPTSFSSITIAVHHHTGVEDENCTEISFWERSKIALCVDYDSGYLPILQTPFTPCEIAILARGIIHDGTCLCLNMILNYMCLRKHFTLYLIFTLLLDGKPSDWSLSDPPDVTKYKRYFGIACSTKVNQVYIQY